MAATPWPRTLGAQQLLKWLAEFWQMQCKFPNWLAMSKKRRSSVTLVGAFICKIVVVFSGSAWIPSRSMTYPRNFTRSLLNSHSSEFNMTPAVCSRFNTAFKRASCLILFVLWTSTSSMWQTIPSSPSRIWLICLWKSSGALEIPKGSLLKQYLPKGVIHVNAVSGLDSLASRTCQNPLFASSLLKSLAPATCSWASVLSTLGMGWTSHRSVWRQPSPHTRGWGHGSVISLTSPPFVGFLLNFLTQRYCDISGSVEHIQDCIRFHLNHILFS